MPGIQELVIILIIVMLLFGAKKIPDLAKGLGIGIKNFKHALKDEQNIKDDDKIINAKQNTHENTSQENKT